MSDSEKTKLLVNNTDEEEKRSPASKMRLMIIICVILAVLVIAGLAVFFVLYFKKDDDDDEIRTYSIILSDSSWSYDSEHNVYYQINVPYVKKAIVSVETIAIFVPGEYFTCAESGSLYVCSVDESGNTTSYTSTTAPIVFPVDTPGYMSQSPITKYNYKQIADYMTAGLIYVHAGVRGRNSGASYREGAPYGVVDFKAAIRYIRYNADKLPGSTDNMFAFGMSGGGAQTALIGASGDSPLYYPYLEDIGAALTYENGTNISDAVAGANCWCPITALDTADAAYEWNMGQYNSANSRSETLWTSALSKDMAKQFAEYVNKLNLKDSDGNALTLTESESGIYNAGTYYDYIRSVVDQSLTNYLNDNFETTDEMETYLQNYSAYTSFDAETKTGRVTDFAQFIQANKLATKNIGAFDNLTRSEGENLVFGITGVSEQVEVNSGPFPIGPDGPDGPFGPDGPDEAKGRASRRRNDDKKTVLAYASHFDSIIFDLLKTNGATYNQSFANYTDYVADFEKDLSLVDALNYTISQRVQMYNPMYYLLSYYEGYGQSTVARYWRIRTGLFQSDTSVTVETNLALALRSLPSVAAVDFATVWGAKHIKAERKGTSDANFIKWVADPTHEVI